MPWLDALLFGGFIGALPLGTYILIGVARTQMLVMVNSVYLHRTVTHHSLEMHPALEVLCRLEFWLCQTSIIKEWVANHRKHHRFVDLAEDPHSPWFQSLWSMFLAVGYRKEAKNQETLRIYGKGTPDDWLENNLFTPHRRLGVVVQAILLVSLFGLVPGACLWVIQVTYLPIFASWGVNGIGHRYGYRNYKNIRGEARNVTPFDPFTCGELLHNNHHARPDSAEFSHRFWEFDIGWWWITLFRILGLVWNVKTHRRVPSPA